MGNEVVCLDVDPRKIELLRKGESPIYEPGLSEMLQKNIAAKRIRFTLDKAEAYRHAETIFICVGTPSDEDGSADLQYVLAVAQDIADELERIGPGGKTKTVVVKSTVPVGTSHKVRDLIRSRTKVPFHIADNPEFLKEGDAISDFNRPDRVVCGVESEQAGNVMRELYEPFVRQGHPILIMDVRSAEMVKYASNAMLACKISFINEMANLCEKYGADVNSVRSGMCADRRIGDQFLYPGLGYGGSCFPKDTLAVVGMGKAVGFDCKLNAAVHEVNQDQRTHFWQKLLAEFPGGLKGLTLAFWGVAFKPPEQQSGARKVLAKVPHSHETLHKRRLFPGLGKLQLAELLLQVLLPTRIVVEQIQALMKLVSFRTLIHLKRGGEANCWSASSPHEAL
jgi:UDPglucose 6-dehydrogenase